MFEGVAIYIVNLHVNSTEMIENEQTRALKLDLGEHAGDILMCCLFFFSSRRRHTRSDRDWSSDVCSSDLSWKERSSARLFFPDATGVGWVFEYALVDKSGKNNLAELRSFQDWHLRYALESVKGVSEVAAVGGFVKQYQVDLDPNKLSAYGIPISEVVNKIRMSNGDVGGKIFEVGSTEFYVRGRGYIKSVEDIENVPLKAQQGTPVYVKNVGTVHLGPDIRRGVAELDGQGEVVGGIVVMRYGENALRVIDGIKKKLAEIKPSLPEGVEIVTAYDRSQLIKRSIATLREKLIEESIVVALVCIVFLWHIRSALVAIFTLPIAIILSFLPMYELGVTSNIMSLGGIAIAIGAMVDSAIIMVENAHKFLEHFRAEHGREAG